MKEIEIEITFNTDYLQHRNPTSYEEHLVRETLIKSLQKDEWNTELAERMAACVVYSDENGCYVPGEHILQAITKAGSVFKISGKGRETYSSIIPSSIVIPEKIYFPKELKYEVFRKFVKIQRNRVLSSRPKFPMNTNIKFVIQVLDDTFPLDMLRDVFEYAGIYKGIGDGRKIGKGRFEVTSWNILKTDDTISETVDEEREE